LDHNREMETHVTFEVSNSYPKPLECEYEAHHRAIMKSEKITTKIRTWH